jgi:hypothetical protein
MIGFDAIGQGAIGELSGDVADAIVYAPAGIAVAAITAAPVIHGGGSVSPSGRTVTVALVAPNILTGATIKPDAAAVTVMTVAGSIQISATVTVSAAVVAVSTAAPLVAAGKLVTAGAAAVAVTKSAPFITAGKSVAPTAANVMVTGFNPGISISSNNRPPAVSVAVTTSPPSILGGNYIDARNTITMVTPYGEIASSSIGQFSIGEGELSSRVVLMSPLVAVSVKPPFITTGKTISPPYAPVSVVTYRPEIDGRTRKLRILAIAS